MGTKKEMSMLMCNEHGCYNLRDILRNPSNKCAKDDCASIESDYANYMHLSVTVGYYHSTSMYVPSSDYAERRSKKDTVVMDDRAFMLLISPVIEDDGKGKLKSSGKKTTRKTGVNRNSASATRKKRK